MKQTLLFCSLFIFSTITFGQKPVDKQKPNILFILTDDLGIGDVGIYYQNRLKIAGKPYMTTPALDKMASEGVQMMQSYCNAPVCAPARASFMSGLSQGFANVRNNQFDKALEDNYNVANLLKASGYETFLVGKWGLQGGEEVKDDPTAWVAHPLNRGFDHFFGYMRHIDGHEHYPKEGPIRGRRQVWDNRTDIAEKLDKCYTGDLFTAMAKKFIIDFKKTNKNKPFFMYLAFDTPHAATLLPTQKYPNGNGLSGGMKVLGTPGSYINTASGTIDSWIDPRVDTATYDHDKNPATKQVPWPNVYKRYATVVNRIDRQVEDVLALLKDLRIDDNTLVVFTSDNGVSNESYLKEDFVPTFFQSFGDFDGIKRDVYEGGIRVPAIVKWPAKIPSGKVNYTPSMLSDFLNTFLDAAQMPQLFRSSGVSLLPALTGNGEQQESNIYVEYFNPSKVPSYKNFEKAKQGRQRDEMQAVRIGNYLGLRYNIKNHADDFEIYNILRDTRQMHNLAGDASFAYLQQQMKDKSLQSRIPNPTAKRPYDKEPVPPAQINTTNDKFSWKFFVGNFPWIADVSGLQPASTGSTNDINQKIATSGGTTGMIAVEGMINIPADGEYKFNLKASSGAVFKLHTIPLLDADYKYSPNSVQSATIILKAGAHPFKLYYKNTKEAKKDVELNWEKV